MSLSENNDLNGTLIDEKKFSKTYQIAENRFMTIITNIPNTFTNADGIEEKIDNTLINDN
ncbi:MAG: hypothetical protein FWC47_05735 [Oscillospiraceae bacterium]|nr:hypothetical protein [Oscillospiraceae bacterium]